MHERGSVRACSEAELDASLLTLSTIRFVDGDDPVMLGTIDAVRQALNPPDALHKGLLRRYRPEAGDGLPGEEGTFSICSFWLVEALALAGRVDEAHEVFDAVCGFGGDLALFAEELDPFTGEHLGNFPQAFTHIGLISAAVRLSGQTARWPSQGSDEPEEA